MMDSVTLENFRCFRERQTVRLAPLTLLVGENSTGKTSFLAMLRILAQLQEGETSIDFKEPPYDLGSFDDIAHNRGGRGGRAAEFTVGVEYSNIPPRVDELSGPHRGLYTFHKNGSAPEMFRRTLSAGDIAVEEESNIDGFYHAQLRTRSGTWVVELSDGPPGRSKLGQYWWFLDQPRRSRQIKEGSSSWPQPTPIDGSPEWKAEDEYGFWRLPYLTNRVKGGAAPTFASAPVRSKPRRTYEPARLDPDPEGDYVPMYLSDLSYQRERDWKALKGQLEEFGRESGLFDELSIRPLGRSRGSDPFQIQVRKGDSRRKGAKRNLADVGYGVSQALPVITELLRNDAPDQFLLQQPEVHLHPSAQAALGTLFCEVAAEGRQLIVETHSDHLMDRVRMDVRDGTTGLKPEDVSLLYFERKGLSVCIHSLRFDELGNVLDAPPGYRRFFLEEGTGRWASEVCAPSLTLTVRVRSPRRTHRTALGPSKTGSQPGSVAW